MIFGSDSFITFGLLAVAAVVGYIVGAKKKEKELAVGHDVSVGDVLKSELQATGSDTNAQNSGVK